MVKKNSSKRWHGFISVLPTRKFENGMVQVLSVKPIKKEVRAKR